MAGHDIIVTALRPGGIEALKGVFSGLPRDLAAAIFITQHVPPDPSAILPRLLDVYGLLPVAYAEDGEAIRPGKVYVAPPDYHLILEPGFVRLSHGPRESLQRPCINAMFRSAAMHYGERACAVLLSGLLDDGAAGLWEIQQRDGVAVVQDPDEARYRSMPESAIRGLTIQYMVRAAEIGPLLARLTMTGNGVNSTSRPAQACVEPGQSSGERATEIGNDVLRRLREQEVLRDLLGYTTGR